MGRFERREIVVDPGQARPYDAADWRDAVVTVERGEIEVEAHDAQRVRFVRGDVVTLDGLAVRALHNRGTERAVLVAVARRLRAVR